MTSHSPRTGPESQGRGHQITVERGTEHVRVVRDGRLLAESRQPLVLRETGCPVRYYLPPADVRIDVLIPSSATSYCPFKGDASYWSVPGGDDVVWSYLDPKPEVAAIAGHYCFYDTELVK